MKYLTGSAVRTLLITLILGSMTGCGGKSECMQNVELWGMNFTPSPRFRIHADDYETAWNVCEKACESDDGYGCLATRELLEREIDEADSTDDIPALAKRSDELLAKARKFLKKECESEDAVSCLYLGMYLPEEETDADKYFNKACELGNGSGCLNDNRKACELDSGLGCFSLGREYYAKTAENKAEERKNRELATEYFKKSCELGSEYGCMDLIALTSDYSYAEKACDRKIDCGPLIYAVQSGYYHDIDAETIKNLEAKQCLIRANCKTLKKLSSR